MADYPKYDLTIQTPARTYQNLVQYAPESASFVTGLGNRITNITTSVSQPSASYAQTSSVALNASSETASYADTAALLSNPSMSITGNGAIFANKWEVDETGGAGFISLYVQGQIQPDGGVDSQGDIKTAGNFIGDGSQITDVTSVSASYASTASVALNASSQTASMALTASLLSNISASIDSTGSANLKLTTIINNRNENSHFGNYEGHLLTTQSRALKVIGLVEIESLDEHVNWGDAFGARMYVAPYADLSSGQSQAIYLLPKLYWEDPTFDKHASYALAGSGGDPREGLYQTNLNVAAGNVIEFDQGDAATVRIWPNGGMSLDGPGGTSAHPNPPSSSTASPLYPNRYTSGPGAFCFSARSDIISRSGSIYATSGNVSASGAAITNYLQIPYSSSTNPLSPLVQTGSMYLSGSFLFIYTGTAWKSASLS